jgi:hypothetical protein
MPEKLTAKQIKDYMDYYMDYCMSDELWEKQLKERVNPLLRFIPREKKMMFKKLMLKPEDQPDFTVGAINIKLIETIFPHPEGHSCIAVKGGVIEVKGELDCLIGYLNCRGLATSEERTRLGLGET